MSDENATTDVRRRHVEDVPQLLRLVDGVWTSAPEARDESVVTTPLDAVLDRATGTTAGFAAFRDPRVDAALRCRLVEPQVPAAESGSRAVVETASSSTVRTWVPGARPRRGAQQEPGSSA